MFELSVLFSLWAFIILMVGTPGPANLLAMSAGSQLGFYKCIPFNLGLMDAQEFLVSIQCLVFLHYS